MNRVFLGQRSSGGRRPTDPLSTKRRRVSRMRFLALLARRPGRGKGFSGAGFRLLLEQVGYTLSFKLKLTNSVYSTFFSQVKFVSNGYTEFTKCLKLSKENLHRYGCFFFKILFLTLLLFNLQRTRRILARKRTRRYPSCFHRRSSFVSSFTKANLLQF